MNIGTTRTAIRIRLFQGYEYMNIGKSKIITLIFHWDENFVKHICKNTIQRFLYMQVLDISSPCCRISRRNKKGWSYLQNFAWLYRRFHIKLKRVIMIVFYKSYLQLSLHIPSRKGIV